MNTLKVEKIIYGIPPKAGPDEVWALDLELSGLNEDQLHRPHGKLSSLAGSNDGKTVYMIFEESEVQEYMDSISDATLVYHNSIFDIGHSRRWAKIPERKNIRDTMLIEKLMYSNYYDDFGLQHLVRRHLGCYMSKEVRKEFSTLDGKMTQEQIDYAAIDAIATWLVDESQQKIIEKIDMQVWNGIDLPTVWTGLDLGGFPFDTESWKNIESKNKEIVDRIEEELGKKYGHMEEKKKKKLKKFWEDKSVPEYDVTEFFVPFNPAAHGQVLELLKSHGVPVESTGEDVIAPYLEKYPIVNTISEYRVAAKKVSSYGLSFLKYVEPDGKIYASFNPTGAETGRSSIRNPALQTIPHDPDYRKCFIAGKGWKLIIADYDSQEPRIFAYTTKDPGLIEILKSGKKIYIEIARMAFDEVITKKGNPDRYDKIKALVLGLMYGLTPYGFARDNGVTIEVAEYMYEKVFEIFPVAAQWIRDQQSVNRGFTRTILGRKCHLHPYNPQWKNNSLNNFMQGGGADMTKIAMREFRRHLEIAPLLESGEVQILLPVHDEIVARCIEKLAPRVEQILGEVMISVGERIHVGIPCAVELIISNSWAEKN